MCWFKFTYSINMKTTAYLLLFVRESNLLFHRNLAHNRLLKNSMSFLYYKCLWYKYYAVAILDQTFRGVYLYYTVQLTGNVAGTRTTRHASTGETCEGTGSPRGTASQTKTTREFNYSQFTHKTSLKGPGTIIIQPVHKIYVTEHSDMQLQHICTLYWTWLLCRSI